MLDKELYDYFVLAQKELSQIKEPERGNIVYLVPSQKARVLATVEHLESLELFNALVQITKLKYCGRKYSIKNFFRRSGFYISCLDNNEIDFDYFRNLYHEAFQKTNFITRYLAPLELVDFAPRKEIIFNSFSIKRFTHDELSKECGNRINNIFYQNAVWDVKKLSMLWYLEVQKTEENLRVFQTNKNQVINLDDANISITINRNLAIYPIPIKLAIYTLILYNWKLPENIYGYGADTWHGFKIPFIFKLNDDLLSPPNPSPDSSQIIMTPYDTSTGEEPGNTPLILFDLNQIETAKFISFIHNQLTLMDEKVLGNWPFMETALGYLDKAFFENVYSVFPGAEQLLWHMTTIESLLGEDEQGLINRLYKRLKRINVINISKTQFDNLYKIRSDLVHGNQWKQKDGKYLYEARNIAMRSCLWFLRVLNYIHLRLHDIKNIPLRNDILTIIDLEEDRRHSVRRLIELLPDDFASFFANKNHKNEPIKS